MADYTRQISASSTMMIRDTGGWVEFWFKTGSQTWNNDQQWSYGANGANSPVLKFRLLAGGGWQKFGEVYVGYNQTVRFTIYNAGLGFPTYDFFQDIGRSRVPDPPTIWDTHAISSSHIHVEFYANYDGGSPILEYAVGYGSNPNGPDGWWGSGSPTDIGPFSSGQRVYFWAAARNAVGWSSWGNRTEATTWRVPDAPSLPIDDVDQSFVVANFQDNYNGGTGITARQIGYGLSSSSPTTTVAASAGPNLISGLSPGKVYYFWARNQNSIGWSAWTPVIQVTLIAGARVYTGGTWRRAVPYVKIDGVWKIARPWVRDAGIWKESSV